MVILDLRSITTQLKNSGKRFNSRFNTAEQKQDQ